MSPPGEIHHRPRTARCSSFSPSSVYMTAPNCTQIRTSHPFIIGIASTQMRPSVKVSSCRSWRDLIQHLTTTLWSTGYFSEACRIPWWHQGSRWHLRADGRGLSGGPESSFDQLHLTADTCGIKAGIHWRIPLWRMLTAISFAEICAWELRD